MPKFVVERDIPGAGLLSGAQLDALSRQSCSVLVQLGPSIQWIESYVTDDKVYSVFVAPSEAMVRRHAEMGRLPASRISRVHRTLGPTTAE